MKKLFFILVFTELAFSQYVFPTNASQKLTATFCEFRAGHFHSGIDIKTWGKEGFPVFAIEDGYVSQIRVSPFGYGKAIYLKLKDGNFAVYGHLSAFNEKLENFVYESQQKNKKYRVVQEFTSEKFPVKKGEILAFTGKTGIGFPHLHFEIRNPQNFPLNPLAFFKTKDTIPPTPQKLIVEPLTENSQINGNFDFKELTLSYKNGFYVVSDTLKITGKAGLGLEVFDKANDVENLFGVYKIQLFIDKKLTFEVAYDSMDFAKTKQIELDRNYYFLRTKKDKINNLFLKNGNSLPFYKNQNNGTFGEEPGIHDFEISVSDFYQNTTKIKGIFHAFSLDQNLEKLTQNTTKNLTFKVSFFDEFGVIKIFSEQAIEKIFVNSQAKKVFENEATFNLSLVKNDTLEIKIGDEIFKQKLVTISKGENKITGSDDGFLNLGFNENSLYNTVFIRIEEGTAKIPNTETLGKSYAVRPYETPLKGEIKVKIFYPKDAKEPEKLGIFYLENNGKWYFLNGETSLENNFIETSVQSFETFVLAYDREKPEIFSVVSNKNFISFKVTDKFSGFSSEEAILLKVNGEKVVFEYDPEDKEVVYKPKKPFKNGNYNFEILATDKVGNSTSFQNSFVVK
ncbi:M23 family metallopeptidase [bacterium]|nr:M23 family metallopeptidase [bacterium]